MLVNRIAGATAATLLALSLAACGGDDEEAETSTEPGSSSPASTAAFEAGTTMADLQSAGALKVGTKFDQPGFGLQNLEGTPEGFDVEVAKIIAAELGIAEDKITYSEAPSAQREDLISNDSVDIVVATYTINDKRKERVGFAGPYYEAGQDLMVAKDNETITGPDDLKAAGSRVCSVEGSTPAETIREYVDADKITLFDVYSKCADALRTGQIDVVTTDNVILLGLVSEAPDDFKLVEKPFTQEPYGIGYKKGDTAFCEFINDTLTKASTDGRYAEAWTSTAGKFSPAVPELPELAACGS